MNERADQLARDGLAEARLTGTAILATREQDF
jgi:hypothetical protein